MQALQQFTVDLDQLPFGIRGFAIKQLATTNLPLVELDSAPVLSFANCL
jgi:hypothetical protein